MTKLVRVMWVPVILVTIYTGWVFWRRNPTWPFGVRTYPAARDPMAQYGNGVRILQFYGPREISSGAKVEICYGVVNAANVSLDPPVERVWPSLSRCFDVIPAKSTRYTLTAEDGQHRKVSQSIEISVKSPTNF